MKIKIITWPDQQVSVEHSMPLQLFLCAGFDSAIFVVVVVVASAPSLHTENIRPDEEITPYHTRRSGVVRACIGPLALAHARFIAKARSGGGVRYQALGVHTYSSLCF